MKKLLYQFDTDPHPSVFDNVVGYDGGADHISAYGGVNAGNVGGLVEGAIFTRSPKDKKNTAIFVGGSNLAQGEAVLAGILGKFFAKFRVSVMFDSNGSNTTAAAAVAWLSLGRSLRGKRAVVLAGSGPVGQRAALLLSREGAQVAVTGRKLSVVQAACDALKSRFGIEVEAIEAPANADRARALEGAHIVLATGASGVTLLDAKGWQENASLELIADANASPPAGIEGVGLSDRGTSNQRKIVFGALGVGALKLALHRACIARLFEQNDLLLDAEEIYAIAKGMVGT
ncbi:MAG TPA: methylene-tetrahydromethanopterin dehydrogenase N-terminal domain-containing protein [Steroidobacteraceae bacterium]|nr:methylene-tetrahydromethanopterin dehydrogenase N-terminal domain-containing protein [Steroidobacteraceae bacterium]